MHTVLFFLNILMVIKIAELCPNECKCTPSMNRVVCNNGNLTAFPPGIPTTTKYLYIQYMKLQKISRNDVLGLKGMISLHLDGNLLKTVEREVFCEMPQLMFLVLSSNKITNLSAKTFSCLKQLEMLVLKDNFFQNLDLDTFFRIR